MLSSKVIFYAIIIAVVASFPAIIWFFKFRKVMIQHQSSLINLLENTFRPRDKRYWLLGYLVGFRAKYWVHSGGIGRVWAVYTTPPHHVFFYLPIILLTKKKERLDVTIEIPNLSIRKGSAHLISEKAPYTVKTLLRTDLGKAKYLETTTLVGKKKYIAYYRGDNSLFDDARELLEKLSSMGTDVYRVSVSADDKAVNVSFNPRDLETTKKILDVLLDEVKKLV